MRIATRRRRRNTIVLTSLVDVLFVLLFFFMLVTNYGGGHSWSMALGGVGDADADQGALVVQVAPDGGLIIDAHRASFDEIEQKLRLPNARAVLVAAPGVSLQTMIDVLDRFKPTGAALTLGRAATPLSAP